MRNINFARRKTENFDAFEKIVRRYPFFYTMGHTPHVAGELQAGLVIAGGMLIPGNIPNIITASKLRISSRSWAVIGLPVGLLLMGIYYLTLFVIWPVL